MADIVKKGPWGGNAGSAWDMGTFTRLARIKITHKFCIYKLQFQFERNGVLQWSNAQGTENGGGTQEEVALEGDEILESIEGCTAEITFAANTLAYHTLTYLIFKTNKRTLGPYGSAKGNVFTVPRDGENMIVDFYGRSGQVIDSLGIYWGPIQSKLEKCTKECEELARKNAELSKKVDKLTEENATLNAKAGNDKTERDQLAKKNEELAKKNAELAKTVDKLTGENASLNATAEKNKTEYDQLANKNEELAKTVDKLTEEDATINANAEKNKMERQELDKKVDDLTEENATLKAEAERNKTAREELEKTVAQLTAENAALRQEKCCPSKPESLRIFAKVDTSYSLTAHNGGVVFAPSDPTNKYQASIQLSLSGMPSTDHQSCMME